MTWRHWIIDARDGRIIAPIDIPSFSWELSVSDFGFETTSDKGTGKEDETGLTIPWTALDAHTPAGRSSLLDSERRGILTCWAADPTDPEDMGTPIMWGKIGPREDTLLDTTFSLESPLTILQSRYAVREGAFKDGTSKDTVSFGNLSFRGICSELGRLATDSKQGGGLPIDWTYLGEPGGHQRTNYQAWNVQNLACSQLITNIANSKGGPDVAFRPYRAGTQHARVRFLAGSDADVYLDMDHPPIVLSFHAGFGSLEDLTVDYQDGYQRWYATGAGQDESTITAYWEDMSAITRGDDPPILREAVYGDTDTDNVQLLKQHLEGVASRGAHRLMQLTGSIDFNDTDTRDMPIHPCGSFWPGERVDLDVDGFPTLPDGRYELRLMEMSGDQTSKASLKFDVLEAPFQ